MPEAYHHLLVQDLVPSLSSVCLLVDRATGSRECTATLEIVAHGSDENDSASFA